MAGFVTQRIAGGGGGKQSRIPPFNSGVKYTFPQTRHSPRGEESERPGKDICAQGNSMCKGTEATEPGGPRLPGWQAQSS